MATGETAGDIEKLLNAAETALDRAKNGGRNRVEPSIGRRRHSRPRPVEYPVRGFWL